MNKTYSQVAEIKAWISLGGHTVSHNTQIFFIVEVTFITASQSGDGKKADGMQISAKKLEAKEKQGGIFIPVKCQERLLEQLSNTLAQLQMAAGRAQAPGASGTPCGHLPMEDGTWKI